MKYTIYNVNQKRAVEFGLKLQDVLILNWTREIIGLPKAFRKEVDGRAYWWFKVDQLLQDYPILSMKKDTVLKKLKQYEKDGFFLKIDELTPRGHFGYYSPTDKYESLFQSHSEKNTTGNLESSFFDSQSEKNPTGSEKNPTGSEKNPTGSEKNPTIPSYYNPKKNTLPLIPCENLTQEQEDAFRFLKQRFEFADNDRLMILAMKHGIYSVRELYKRLEKDIRTGKVKGIGAFLNRLDRLDRVVKPVLSDVPSRFSGKDRLHINDSSNKALMMLKSGCLSSTLSGK